jgi:hypothetical protein
LDVSAAIAEPRPTMMRIPTAAVVGSAALLALLAGAPSPAEAQGRGNGARAAQVDPGVALSIEATARIREYYGSRAPVGAEGLPPGIRKNLARGKPLPPGIAKKVAPAGLRSTLGLPSGYELVEVGLDVLLVEVATSVVHDVLRDVIR